MRKAIAIVLDDSQRKELEQLTRNAHNENPKPFIWTASATDILAKVKRAQKALNKI